MLHLVSAFGRIGEENAFAVLARATELARQGRDIINLGIGQPDFPTPPHIVEAAHPGAARRPPRLYAGDRHPAPARGRRRPTCTGASPSRSRPDSVMIVPGGKVTMFMAILMFGEPGAEILYPDPGFPIYRSMIEFTGATPDPGADPRGERLRLLGGGDPCRSSPPRRGSSS